MIYWNIFAQELETILASRGLGLGHLDDRAGIHSAKVYRLKHSLIHSGSTPVLNVEEMDDVVSAFTLNYDEVIHLRAALLAASVQNMLSKRIDPSNALLAAKQVLPYVSAALYKSQGSLNGLSQMKGMSTNNSNEHDIEYAFGSAWDAIDDGTILLHLSHNVLSLRRSVSYAEQAFAAFETAIQELEDISDDIQATEEWDVWYKDAQAGLESAKKRLHSLSV